MSKHSKLECINQFKECTNHLPSIIRVHCLYLEGVSSCNTYFADLKQPTLAYMVYYYVIYLMQQWYMFVSKRCFVMQHLRPQPTNINRCTSIYGFHENTYLTHFSFVTITNDTKTQPYHMLIVIVDYAN